MDWFGSPTTYNLACMEACSREVLPPAACAGIACGGIRLCTLIAWQPGLLALEQDT